MDIIYSAEFNTRTFIMAILVTIWGLRLTYNFSRSAKEVIVYTSGEEKKIIDGRKLENR